MLKRATVEQVLAVGKALFHLRLARDHLQFAEADRATDKVRDALKSAEGARRHIHRRFNAHA